MRRLAPIPALLLAGPAAAASCPAERATFVPLEEPRAAVMRPVTQDGRTVFELASRGTAVRHRFALVRRPNGASPLLRPLADREATGLDHRAVFLGADLRAVGPGGRPVAYAFFEGLWGAMRDHEHRTGRPATYPPEGLWVVSACRP
jgi:hypothetical protein